MNPRCIVDPCFIDGLFRLYMMPFLGVRTCDLRNGCALSQLSYQKGYRMPVIRIFVRCYRWLLGCPQRIWQRWRSLVLSVLVLMGSTVVLGVAVVGVGFFISNVTADFVANGMPFAQAQGNVHTAVLIGAILLLAWILPPGVRQTWRLFCAAWSPRFVRCRTPTPAFSFIRVHFSGGSALRFATNDQLHESHCHTALQDAAARQVAVTMTHPDGPVYLRGGMIVGWHIERSSAVITAAPEKKESGLVIPLGSHAAPTWAKPRDSL